MRPLRADKEPYPGRRGRRYSLASKAWSQLLAATGVRCLRCRTYFRGGEQTVRQHRPDVLLIEPFLENRDAIRWIKDLATEFPRIRILVVSRQSERTYAERALCAGASGYWMKNSSVAELMHAIETVLAGEIYASRAITGLAMHKFAGGRDLPPGLDLFSDREMAVFSLIAAGHGCGQIAKELGISRKTVESHSEHIKLKLGYANAEELKRGARELLGTSLTGFFIAGVCLMNWL